MFWGQDDIFFTRAGGDAYLNDIPNAEMHRLDSGHFAVEDCLEYLHLAWKANGREGCATAVARREKCALGYPMKRLEEMKWSFI
jgi:hypothetical protein